MKWSNRIAQGFSPGLGTPQDRPESGDRTCGVESRLDVINSVTGIVVLEETAPLGRHFQGGVRTCRPRAKALGYSVRPFHGQEPEATHQPPTTDHY